MATVFAGALPFVITRCAHRLVGEAKGIDQLIVAAWMTYPNRPRFSFCIATSDIEVAAGIDCEILKGPKLARGKIDGEPLGDGAEVENQRTKQRDRPAVWIQANVPIAHGAAWFEGFGCFLPCDSSG